MKSTMLPQTRIAYTQVLYNSAIAEIKAKELAMPDLSFREDLLDTLERERAAMLELLPRFGDEQLRTVARADGWTAHDIAMHTADSNYGLALMVLGEIPPNPQINEQ